MTSSNDERDERPPQRRRYEVPAVIESATFETLALACGKDDSGTNAACGPPFGMPNVS